MEIANRKGEKQKTIPQTKPVDDWQKSFKNWKMRFSCRLKSINALNTLTCVSQPQGKPS